MLESIAAEAEEGYIKLDSGGWRGVRVPVKPEPGTGAYVYYRRGDGVRLYRNETRDDTLWEEVQFAL